MQEQRQRDNRLPLELAVHFRLGDLGEVQARESKNLSQGGIFIRCPKPAPVGERVLFEIDLGDDRTLTGVGRVAWGRKPDPRRRELSPGMGVEFVELSPKGRAYLDELLRAHEGAAADDLAPPNGSWSAPTRGDVKATLLGIAAPVEARSDRLVMEPERTLQGIPSPAVEAQAVVGAMLGVTTIEPSDSSRPTLVEEAPIVTTLPTPAPAPAQEEPSPPVVTAPPVRASVAPAPRAAAGVSYPSMPIASPKGRTGRLWVLAGVALLIVLALVLSLRADGSGTHVTRPARSEAVLERSIGEEPIEPAAAPTPPVAQRPATTAAPLGVAEEAVEAAVPPAEPAASVPAQVVPTASVDPLAAAREALAAGRSVEAVRLFREAIAHRAPPMAFSGLGQAYEKAGNREAAIEAYRTLIQLRPDVPEADRLRRRIRYLGGE